MTGDSVKALTHWRRGRDLIRSEVTREALPESAKAILLKMAAELDQHRAELRQLKSVLARLAIEARESQ